MLICVTAVAGQNLAYYNENPVPPEQALANETKQFWVAMVALSGIFTFIALCLTIFLAKRINLTIKLRFMTHNL